jgi:hypothetical protein
VVLSFNCNLTGECGVARSTPNSWMAPALARGRVVALPPSRTYSKRMALGYWHDFGQLTFGTAAVKMVWINILLCGNNLVPVAMACPRLPASQRLRGTIAGFEHGRHERGPQHQKRVAPKPSAFSCGGGAEGCNTLSTDQSLMRRCGRYEGFEGQRLFSLVPAPRREGSKRRRLR